ncbi:hypothetical protein ABZ403_20235 [Micromonospora zamorensis]|uniref:hypothetical protein n=1 Tax=Micromonospora zamorensis TaxID=709883 RepID=UPI0033C3A9B2
MAAVICVCERLRRVKVAQETLDAAAANSISPAWARIWNGPSPDGTWDLPEPAVLPWLARTCSAFSPRERVEVLALAGVVARAADAASRTLYAQEIATLRALACDGLADEAFHDSTFVGLQQAVLGLDGEKVWSSELSHIKGGEAELECPACESELLLCLEPGESTIEPGLSSELAERLHVEAVQAGREFVATSLTKLFGRFTCPECRTTFNIADQVASGLAE